MEMLDNISRYEVILASASPRRKQLLEQLCINFSVKTISGLDETYPMDLDWKSIPEYLSLKKAQGHASLIKADTMLITADTLVMLDGVPLGKPKSCDDAKRMLRLLSGKTHYVITGVTIMTARQTKSFSVTTEVDFADLTDDEINFYVERFNPVDKAGAYGIQEWIGSIGISRIKGSFYNVMGLPLHRLYTELKNF